MTCRKPPPQPRLRLGKQMSDMLHAIHRLGGYARNRDLAREVGISGNAVTTTIRNLDANGFVEVEGRSGDRTITITDKGWDVLEPRAPGYRNCLMCGHEFPSFSVGERVCVNCKNTDDWRSSANAAHVVQEAG